MPGPTTHRAAADRLDPVVTFYSSSQLNTHTLALPAPPRPRGTPTRKQAGPILTTDRKFGSHIPKPSARLVPAKLTATHSRHERTRQSTAPTPNAIPRTGLHGRRHNHDREFSTNMRPGGPIHGGLPPKPALPGHVRNEAPVSITDISTKLAVDASASSSSSSPSPSTSALALVKSPPRPEIERPFRTAHQRKAAIRRAARAGGYHAGDAGAKASLLAVAREALAMRRGADGGDDSDGRDDGLTRANDEEGKVGGNRAGGMGSQHKAERVREGATALLSAIKAMSVWQVGVDDGQKVGNDKQGNHEKQSDGSDSDPVDGSEMVDENKVMERPLGRIAWAGKKKLDDVFSRLGGHSAKGERFVMKPRPEMSDLADASNDDAYFQELMKGG